MSINIHQWPSELSLKRVGGMPVKELKVIDVVPFNASAMLCYPIEPPIQTKIPAVLVVKLHVITLSIRLYAYSQIHLHTYHIPFRFLRWDCPRLKEFIATSCSFLELPPRERLLKPP